MAGKLLSDVSDVEHTALLHMVCHHCCRVDAIAGATAGIAGVGVTADVR